MLSSPSGLLLKGIFPKNFPISYWYNFLNHISQSSALGSFSYGDNQNKSFPVGNKIYAQMMSCKKNLDYTCSKLALLHWHKSLCFTIWQHSCELSRFFWQPGGNYSDKNLCSTLLFNGMGIQKIFDAIETTLEKHYSLYQLSANSQQARIIFLKRVYIKRQFLYDIPYPIKTQLRIYMELTNRLPTNE